MNRVVFESRLQALLDERRWPSLDAELARAADANPELRRLLSAYEALAAASFPTPATGAELTERVLSELRQAPAPLRAGLPEWLTPLAAVAATLLIATTIALLARGPGEARVAEHPAQDNAAVASAPAPPARGLNQISRQAAANYRALAANTEASLSSALSVVQPNREPRAKSSAKSDWLNSVPENLRPLSNSASGAVYSLMRAVPGATSDPQEGL